MDLEELRSVREQERRTDSLQHLRDSFYDDAAEYVRQLKHERSRRAEQAGDPYAPAAMRLTDEIDTAEEVIESLYERRRGKVVKLASFAAAGMPAETDGMTEQERSMFDDVVARIEHNEERVLGALDGGADAAETQAGDGVEAVGEATDAAHGVPATDTAGTTSAADAARTSGEADAVGSPTEADTLGATDATDVVGGAADETETLGAADETEMLDGAEPVDAAPTPGANEEPVAAEASEHSAAGAGVGVDGSAEPTDGSVLADAMGGPAPSGDDSADETAAADQSDDRPAAEAAVATGVAEPSTSEGGTDAVGGPEPGPSTDGPTATDESATGGAPAAGDPTTGDTPAVNGTPGDGASAAATNGASATGTEGASSTPTEGASTTTAAGAPSTAAEGVSSTPTEDAPSTTAERRNDAAAEGESADDTPTVERATVRVTSDVGEVFGVDDRTYELAASDVVHLPQVVAEPLVERGAAERL